ncbi:non-ribosomal peptide synthetase [Legionella micdadei]|uniref:non-ribosomal peptide synthetase n=1 Tax=Legionella micdadei TaxID=451 RepID=UPI0012EBB9AB|nr:non-ribosomal peptide synthetase [Legionella micdadei]
MNPKKIACMLTDNQLGIFYETIRAPHPIYISQMCLTFKGKFDYQLFQQAYRLVISRHEILRTAFSLDKLTANATPVQTIYENVEPIVHFHDYTNLPFKEKDALFRQFLDTDLVTSFDFNIPSLMRLTAIRFSENEYRIIWSRHHILLDGSSARLVLTELLTIYSALLSNKPWKLPPSSSYFAIKDKFVVPNESEAMQYWKKQLKNFSKCSLLPAIPKQATIQHFTQLNSKLTHKEYKNLFDFVAKYDLTVNSVLQAAWGIVLSHYSNNEHIIFGSVRAFPREEVANCAGLFINTLPLALTVNPHKKVLTYLRSVRKQGKALRGHTHTSLSEIRKWCGLTLDEMLYQSILDYKPYSLNKILKSSFSELNCETSFRLTTPYPLALEITNEEDYLDIRLNYATELFSPELAEGMLAHFRSTLNLFHLYHSKTLNDLPSLPDLDREKSVMDWNKTQKNYPFEKTLHQLFEERVNKNPDAPAIFYKDETITYEKLNTKANQLARFINKRGVKPEALTLILTASNINLIVSTLAVLKAGRAYVPVDLGYPLKRIRYLISDSEAEIIICDNKTYPMVSQVLEGLDKSIELINLDTISLSSFCPTNLEVNVSPSHLAYMIYTSGSTGKPKGVLVEHRSVVNMALGCIERLEVTENSRILQIASFGFDVAVAEWSMAFLSGASLCLMDKEFFDPNAIIEALEFYKISTIILASSILTALPHRKLPHLKVIAVGGESCSDAVINYWAKDRLFLNVYGITEATVCSTIANCVPGQEVLSIGKPLPNTQIYILNEKQQPLPIGIYGEIYIGGLGVARGYWNNPDLTGEKFIRNPFIIEQENGDNSRQHRLYRTGDRGRWLFNGELEFLGRVDEQVKIMGVRIELPEIEKAIEQHPEVEKAAVILTPDNKHLQGFILSHNVNLNLENIRQFLRTILPHALIPQHLIIVEKLPLTSNGKINKKKLLNFPVKDSAIEIKEEQLTGTEEIVSSEIKKIIGINNIPLDQNFLDMGLKSIDLVGLSLQLSDCLRQEVSVIHLFSNPTIKALAHYLDSLKSDHNIEEKLVLKKHSLNAKYQKPQRINFKNDDVN